MSRKVLCDYCGKPATYVKGDVIYPHRPDLYQKRFWLCAPCGAHVGVHIGSDTPLGRLADASLRRAKMKAHAAFDPIWQAEGGPKSKRRGKAYKWLAGELGIEMKDCHIGMFDVAMCWRTVDACMARRAAS